VAVPHERSLTWMPIVGAAVIALIGVIVIVVVGSGHDDRTGLKTDSDGALVCPAVYKQEPVTGRASTPRAYVPLRPTGIDGSQDLVPDTKPLHVTVCRYAPQSVTLSRSAAIPVDGRRVLTSGGQALTRALSKAPKSGIKVGACSGPGTTYMMGFVFATGAAWVTVPGTACQSITNGVYDSSVDIRDQVVAAFASGAWR